MTSTRIYVGHLPYKARESDVENFFSRYGKIREILLKNGFGFVEFDDARDAEEAVYRCNGKELRGERVIVEMTKRPPKGRDMYGGGRGRFGGGGGGGYGGGRPNYYRSPPRRREEFPVAHTKHRLIVENLSSRTSWQDLKDIMRQAGEVTYADAHRIRKNEGLVCFSTAADLKKALDTMDGKEINGRKIKLLDGTRDSRGRSRSRSGSRSSRSPAKNRKRSHSRSRSSHSRSSRSSSRSSRSHSKSGSRSRSRSPENKKKRAGSREKSDDSRRNGKSASRSVSPRPKEAAHRSQSPSPKENDRRSDVDED